MTYLTQVLKKIFESSMNPLVLQSGESRQSPFRISPVCWKRRWDFERTRSDWCSRSLCICIISQLFKPRFTHLSRNASSFNDIASWIWLWVFRMIIYDYDNAFWLWGEIALNLQVVILTILHCATSGLPCLSCLVSTEFKGTSQVKGNKYLRIEPQCNRLG